jgi:hypothetical protein
MMCMALAAGAAPNASAAARDAVIHLFWFFDMLLSSLGAKRRPVLFHPFKKGRMRKTIRKAAPARRQGRLCFHPA